MGFVMRISKQFFSSFNFFTQTYRGMVRVMEFFGFGMTVGLNRGSNVGILNLENLEGSSENETYRL